MSKVLIGLVLGLAPSIASVFVALRQMRAARKQAERNKELSAELATLNSDLEVQRHKLIAAQDREMNAEDVLTKYREPLAAAAYDLQSRCYNILELKFFEKFGPGHPRFDEAQETTLFRFAQYFGWTEILRRDVQFLSFPEKADTREVTRLQGEISRRIATSDSDEPLMIWADEQRAIGERMIVEEHGKVMCMGYAKFHDEFDACFAMHCDRMRAEFLDPQARARLRDVQELLCDLVRALDKDKLRYSDKDIGREDSPGNR